MKEKRYVIELDWYERNILINALNMLRTQQLAEDKTTEPIDEIIIKIGNASVKRTRGVWNADR